MGGKGSEPQYSQQQINDAAYQAGASGQKWNDVTKEVPYGHDQALQSWMQGNASTKAMHAPHFGGGGHAPHGAGGYDFASAQAESQASFEAQMQAQQDALAQQEAERRRIEGENARDALYSNYLDAAGSATDFINAQINEEIANAQLLGIDYNITDEMKSGRISDYFASIWGEGQQGQLQALMDEWGNPKGFEGWTVTRGDAENVKPVEGEETTVGQSKGMRPGAGNILAEDEDQVLGGQTAILGA